MSTINDRIKKHFLYISKIASDRITSADFVLVYPKYEIRQGFDPEETRQTLQNIINLIKEVTGLDLVNNELFDSTVLIGYDKSDGLRWAPDNTVLLPWGYLKNGDQPVEACMHELAHPFFHMTALHKQDAQGDGTFGDGFCDFMKVLLLRGPVKLPSKDAQYVISERRDILQREPVTSEDYRKAEWTLRLLEEFERRYPGSSDKEDIERFLQRFLLNCTDLENQIANLGHS